MKKQEIEAGIYEILEDYIISDVDSIPEDKMTVTNNVIVDEIMAIIPKSTKEMS